MRKTLGLALTLLAMLSCKKTETPAATATATTTTTQSAVENQARGATATSETAEKVDVGSAMPEYTALNLDGSKFDLATKRDKVVLLNVWATWCGPCRYEIPELEKLHIQMAGKGLEVIGVSVDESGAKSVEEFVVNSAMTYPIVLDADGKIANLLQTSVLPTSILIDRNGKIVWKKFGAILEGDQELAKAIAAAL